MASSPDDLIKLKVVPSAEEAAALIGLLRDQGIPAHLEQPAGLTDCLTMASPMFEVSVRRADLVAAGNLIAEGRPARTEWATECEQCGYSLAGLKPPARCPECGWDSAEHAYREPAPNSMQDLSGARRRLFPWLAGWGLIAVGGSVLAAGITIMLTGPHGSGVLWMLAGARGTWLEGWQRSGPETPSGFNVGVVAVITLGLVIALLGLRDLRRR